MNKKLEVNDKRLISLQRAEQLKEAILDYQQVRGKIPTGFKYWPLILKRQEKIRSYFGATAEQWQNWRWHLRNRISSTKELQHFINLKNREIEEIDSVGSHFSWAISPYYLSLMDPDDHADPIRRQAIPSIYEYSCPYGEDDPMDEEYTSPAPAV
ncbi:MAG TPA: lysine 2,3-aminomutase, partial [Firmicutes bacterium]|nr:lysine 2,3-aminomutase [Bacillota bacterium]